MVVSRNSIERNPELFDFSQDHQEIELEDLEGNHWVVDIGDTIWRGRLRPTANLKIKIIGKMTAKTQFVADEIRAWQRREKNKGEQVKQT